MELYFLRFWGFFLILIVFFVFFMEGAASCCFFFLFFFPRTALWSTRSISLWKGNLPSKPTWNKHTLEFFPVGGRSQSLVFLPWGRTVFSDLDRLEDLAMQPLQDQASICPSPSSFHFLSDGKKAAAAGTAGVAGVYFLASSLYFPLRRQCLRSALTASATTRLCSLLTSEAASLKATEQKTGEKEQLLRTGRGVLFWKEIRSYLKIVQSVCSTQTLLPLEEVLRRWIILYIFFFCMIIYLS